MVGDDFRIKGAVLSRFSGAGSVGLKVEAWDKDAVIDDLLGVATTDARGHFEIQFTSAAYQEICVDRRPDVYFRVYSDGDLVCSTEDSVLWNVERHDIQVTISVDRLAPDSEQRRPKAFAVRGRVARPDGVPLVGLRVVAVERDVSRADAHGERLLGETRTDKAGHYLIRYTAEQLANPAKGSADLVVRVLGETSREPLASSPLILNALDEEVVNLSIGQAPYHGRSEYEVVDERLRSLPTQARGELSDQDIVAVANQTGLTGEQVQLYAESQKQARRAGVDGAVLYGLYRAGMPRSLAALTVQSRAALGAALERALQRNLIPVLDRASIGRAVAALAALGVGELLDKDSPARVRAAHLLDLIGLSAEEKRTVLEAYAASPPFSGKFWQALQAGGRLGQSKVESVRRLFVFNALSLDHLPLVEKLAAQADIGSLRDVAAMDGERWTAFLRREGVPAPEWIPGADAVEKQANYARLLGRLNEDAFPTAAFSGGWARDLGLDRDVAAFFERNPDFAFEATGINAYMRQNPQAVDGLPDPAAVTAKLRAVQNLFRIAPRFERLPAVGALWRDGIRSAHAVKRMGQGRFVARYEPVVGRERVRYMYSQAERVVGLSLVATAKYAWDPNGVTPYVIPASDLDVAENDAAAATLRTLFGDLDFCPCEHCRSVLGPAAYLADLLLFLDRVAAGQQDTALERLFARRPDIGNIRLDCDNANTPLPYIDLVLEVLEDAVSPRTYRSVTHELEDHRTTTVFEGEVPQTDETRPPYLRASPEHLNPDAYDVIDGAIFPWTLPFNLWAEEARAYLGQLGVKRHQLMEVFSGPGASSSTVTEVLCEALGLTPLERSLLVGRDNFTLGRRWGGALPAAVHGVEPFLAQTGLQYDELTALLQCRRVNPPGPDQIEISFAEEHPCSLGDAVLTPLDDPKLDRLHRFIRLRRKLGWSFFDLDRALVALDKTAIDDDLLEKLSRAVHITGDLGVGLLTVLSWWSPRLDTHEYVDTPSQYTDLFRNRAVGELTEAARATLTLNATGDEVMVDQLAPVAMTDGDYEPVILGAARLRKDDLAAIIAEDLLGDATLNLARLSHVVRVASFSQAVGLSVPDYYLLRKLTGLQPVSSPPTAQNPAGYPTAPGETQALLEARRLVAGSGLSVSELAYLLAHDTSQANHGQMPEPVIAQRLTEIRTDLAALRSAYRMPSDGLDAALGARLGELLGDEPQRATALRIVLGGSPLSTDDQKSFIEEHFAIFLDAAAAGDQLVGPVNALGDDDVAARASYVLAPLLEYLLTREGRRHLQAKLSESLAISADAASALLDAVRQPAGGDRSAWQILRDEPFVTDARPVEASAHGEQFAVYERLAKASRLLAALGVGAGDQAFVVTQGSSVGFVGVDALPQEPLAAGPTLADLFGRFAALVRALEVGPRIFTSGMTLTGFLAAAQEPGLTADQITQLLTDNTAWPLDDIRTLTARYGYGVAELRQGAWLVQLYKAFSILKRLGVRAAQAWAWNTAEVTNDQAAQIRFAVKSKYDNQEWLAVAPALRDPLRERQRDALLAYVIHNGVPLDPLQPAGDRQAFAEADDVYGHLLIDPQMSACLDTSRIKQAIASVQLFVQRALMGLEPGVAFTPDDARQWQWRKTYRVWEAARKVFLWPENWIYPDLRADKSPFFEALENDLSQSDLDDTGAEHALMAYLKKLDEVAHLEVSGLYEDAEQGVLHVVARTQSTPHKYFYRRRLNGEYWTAWEPVEADIEGSHLIPVVHNRRLFLFWPKFVEKAEQPTGGEMTVVRDDSSAPPPDPRRYYEIRLAWTQYRDRKWYETRVSEDFFQSTPAAGLRPKEEFYFFAERTSNGDLFFRCRLEPVELDRAVLEILRYDDVSDAVQLYRPPSGMRLVLLGAVPPVPYVLAEHIQLNKLPDADNVFMSLTKDANERELSALTHADVDTYGDITASTKNTLLSDAEEGFRVMLPHQYPTYTSQAPFFYTDSRRVFFVEPGDVSWSLGDDGVSGAFALPQQAYSNDVWNRILDMWLALPAESGGLPSGASGDRPFFDGDDRYYAGNEAGGLVIDRERGLRFAMRPVGPPRPRRPEGNGEQPTTPGVVMTTAETSVIDPYWTGVDPEDLYDAMQFLGHPLRSGKRYRFHDFYHPHIPLMIRQLNRHGVAGLLASRPEHGAGWEALDRQQADPERARYFRETYDPNEDVVDLEPDHVPKEDFDFRFAGAYSQYNWELFFHAPLLIAERLMQNQRFEEAQKWFHYIFDPTEVEGLVPGRFWKIKPFFEYAGATSIEALLDLLNRGDEDVEKQVAAWVNDPFDPHLMARMRTVAYMRAVVMKYLDNLIAWGDSLFRRDTLESINEATQLYVLAAQTLGRRPARIARTGVSPYTFNELLPQLDEFANARVTLESFLPWMTVHRGDPSDGQSGVLETFYFCLPPNDKLLAYWDTVADRLYKIRHCLNIEGVRRQLALFEPPIDPGLLVRARASGLDVSSIVSDLGAPLSHYRFRVMLQRATDFCSDVRALGGALLQALERRDEADLAVLRAGHQVSLLKSLREVKIKAKAEAEKQKVALAERQRLAEIRRDHYAALEFMNPLERASQGLHVGALVPHAVGMLGEIGSAIFAMQPSFQIGASGIGGSPHVSTYWGSENIASSTAHMNSFFFQLSGLLGSTASIIGTLASYQRRKEEWDLQHDLAVQELKDLSEQLAAAQDRIDLADADLRGHYLQIAQASDEAAFLETRFTSRELYSWTVTQVATLYFQAYQMAHDLAKKAEQGFRFETGVRDTSFIHFGYWDSLKKGLLAGEQLHKDLRRLEAAYLELNRREFELTKHVSLAQLDPLALLQLQQTGGCEFSVPEVLFDLDHPGHYMRRIKTVRLSIPCVVGPYTTVGTTLTLLEDHVRVDPTAAGGYAYQGLSDPRFIHDLVGVQSIATSSGQNDAGLFELSFGDERYLPFEGAGVLSAWRLELPGEYRQFDYDTISDVILHVSYTARDGGELLKTAAQEALRESLNRIADILAVAETGLTRIVSAAQEFGSEWHRFLYPPVLAEAHEITLALDKRLFPFMLHDRALSIQRVTVGFLLADPGVYEAGGGLNVTWRRPDGTQTRDELASATTAGQPAHEFAADFTLEREPRQVGVQVTAADLAPVAAGLVTLRDGRRRLNPGQVKDMFLVISYTIAR